MAVMPMSCDLLCIRDWYPFLSLCILNKHDPVRVTLDCDIHSKSTYKEALQRRYGDGGGNRGTLDLAVPAQEKNLYGNRTGMIILYQGEL